MILTLPLILSSVQAPLSRQELVAAIRENLEARAARGTFSGAVLVAHEDEVLFTFACGEADKGLHAANNLETRFNLGSMNKMFTSVAVALLVEQGKLAFADPIREYVDESWLPPEITARITVRHLLTLFVDSGYVAVVLSNYGNVSREVSKNLRELIWRTEG
jgi:CubicO group peptidase (beta-lactamase class C family)